MIFFQTIAVAFAMFSAVPVPQFEWNEKNMRYAMCAFPLIGLVIGGLWSLCWWPLPAPGAGESGRVLSAPGLGHGRHPSGRLRRHLRRPFQLRRPGKEAGDPEGPPLRGLCRDPTVQLFPRLFCAVHRRAVYPAHRVPLGRWLWCWSGHFPALAVAAFPMAKNTGLAHTFASAADRKTVAQRSVRRWPSPSAPR